MTDNRVLCISAGLLQPKKKDNPLARDHLYLNYGLLGLATVLRHHGYSPRVFHGKFLEPETFVANLVVQDWLVTEHPILLSVPSCFALPWARKICEIIKERDPRCRIVVGGRWVVATDGEWIRSQLPHVDLVVFDTAEDRIEALLNIKRWPFITGTDRTGRLRPASTDLEPPALDYHLLDECQDYHPSVEVSRGCGMGCVYCAEASAKLSRMKSPTHVANEISQCQNIYNKAPFNPYFESSYFRPTSEWITGLRAALDARDLQITWRTETRVDGLSSAQITGLARTGLKVLDLGLESASLTQLLAMGKTTAPDVYLRRASELLRACADNGIWTKVNVLLFPGETRATVDESCEWLDAHRQLIKGISASPTIVYRYGQESLAYLATLASFGAHPVDPASLHLQGHSNLHLSAELDNAAAIAACRAISRSFMTARDYFDLKKFSYLPRGFSWQDFESRLSRVDEASLSFSTPEHFAQT